MRLYLILFFLLFANIESAAQNFDANILKSVNTNRNKSLDNSFMFITNSVAPISIASSLATLGTGLIKKDKTLQSKGWELTASVFISTGTGYLMKRIIKRNRPFVDYSFIDPYKPYTDYSFPSNHATLAFATATSLTINFNKWYVAVPAYGWAGLVAYSRLHLGVHYPTDVLAGAVLGSGTAILTHKANQWLQKKKTKKFISH